MWGELVFSVTSLSIRLCLKKSQGGPQNNQMLKIKTLVITTRASVKLSELGISTSGCLFWAYGWYTGVSSFGVFERKALCKPCKPFIHHKLVAKMKIIQTQNSK